MSKGNLIAGFKKGDRIMYTTTIKLGDYKSQYYTEVKDQREGAILKILDKTGRSGSAFVKPADGSKKITRKLIHCSLVSNR